jgi:hypothetical protein
MYVQRAVCCFAFFVPLYVNLLAYTALLLQCQSYSRQPEVIYCSRGKTRTLLDAAKQIFK